MNDRLTQSDIDKMQQEIEHRKLVLRPQLLVDVKEARAHGDLSENFEYKAAKKAKNQNESRIRYLEKMIKTARIIEDNTADDEIGAYGQGFVAFTQFFSGIYQLEAFGFAAEGECKYHAGCTECQYCGQYTFDSPKVVDGKCYEDSCGDVQYG